MILQEGRYYKARDGKIHGPLNRYEQERVYQFFCSKYTWTEGGKISIGIHTSDDLISEVTFSKAKAPALTPDAAPKVDRVVLASRILPRLAPDLAPSMAARQALQYADAFLKEIDNADS
jgi:hypothetical protein